MLTSNQHSTSTQIVLTYQKCALQITPLTEKENKYDIFLYETYSNNLIHHSRYIVPT